MCNLHIKVYNLHFEVYHLHFGVYNLNFVVYNYILTCIVYTLKCIIYTMMCIIYSTVSEWVLVALRHMQRYFSYICDDTDVQADWINRIYGRAPNAIDI